MIWCVTAGPRYAPAILNKIAGISNCGDVTAAHLDAITGTLNLSSRDIISLKLGDFDGLTGLNELNLFRNFPTPPAGIFDELTGPRQLDMAEVGGRTRGRLPAGIFDELTGLEHLNLAGCLLTTLPAGIFDNNTTLKMLFLPNNNLTTVPADIFDNLTALDTLYLHGNSGLTLPANIFDELVALEGLHLSRNNLTTLPADIFDNLTALKYLYLSHNNLTTLPENIFDNLTVLAGVLLDRNPGEPFSPVRNAGSDQMVSRGAVVSLSGAATGPWGNNVAWEWVQVDGANSNTVVTDGVTLTGATDATASFTAPSRTTTLHFKLTARSAAGPSRGTASGVD